MGHYYSEMCCETCGGIPCRCPRKPRPDEWLIIWPGEIVKEPGGFQRPPWRLPHFKSLKEAQDAMPGWVEEHIKKHEVKLEKLQTDLNHLYKLKNKLEELNG